MIISKTLPASSGKSPTISKPLTAPGKSADNIGQGEPNRNLLSYGRATHTSPSGKAIGGVIKGGPSSKEAAANWLQSAQTEVQSSPAHSEAVRAMAVSMLLNSLSVVGDVFNLFSCVYPLQVQTP